MSSFQHVIDRLLQVLIQFGELIMGIMLTIELWLRAQLEPLGLSHAIQTLILFLVAVVLIAGALRMFGGLIRFAIVLFLILLLIDIFLPVVQH